jgi:hypothetical protein
VVYRPGEIAQIFRVDAKTVSRWDLEGKFPQGTVFRTGGGHRRFHGDRIRLMLAVAALNADFRPRWRVWLSTPSPGRQPRVCASRAFPTSPHPLGADPDLSRKFTPSGEVLDAGTASEMLALLTARTAS